MTLRPNLTSQHNLLLRREWYRSLACNAASLAIERDELPLAIELLEQGRGLLWSQLRGLRSPLDELKRESSDLAEGFEAVSQQLEQLATLSPADIGREHQRRMGVHDMELLSDEMLARKHRLTVEQDLITEEIRGLPGFEDFLRPTCFAKLQRVADEGPVIVVNMCTFRSDVIIILPGGDCVSVPLNDGFYNRAYATTKMFLHQRRTFGPSSKEYDVELTQTMGFLWQEIVCRVVKKLDEVGIKKESRIWWCPTSVLTALPFHAAGPYTAENGRNRYLLDDYVSSYTPTLMSLIDARSKLVSKNSCLRP